ncbi:translation initiation factor SUI1 [Cephaloticoccus primus]|uniref:Translation initiation factor SUI1 n=1 Tax=Cephaloticoccus primus TaxID=1548207 RepID=A0A139SJI9_9BACT|nr:translation initiation factor [Cephaloticoccus primus]KXU34709.1 translation initiation factor SUI1 [Cephaloticoccus primus]
MSRPAKPGRVSTSGGESLGQNPFGNLSAAGLPEAAANAAACSSNERDPAAACAPPSSAPQNAKAQRPRDRGRVDIRRSTAGRGGKTVSLISGFVGISAAEKDALCKTLRGACGCGGTVKDGAIEIQGDQREKIAALLRDAGFRPVFSGG